MLTRSPRHMRAHALSKGLVYGTGILIVIDSLDAIAGGSSDILQVVRGWRMMVFVMCVCWMLFLSFVFVICFCYLFLLFVMFMEQALTEMFPPNVRVGDGDVV